MPCGSRTSRSWGHGLPRDVGVIVPAGGVGARAGEGEPKQFRPIGGVPMLLRAIRPFAQHPRVRQIVVPLPAPWADAPPAWLSEHVGDRLRVVSGGSTRADSVAAGLDALDPACAIVLIHDAARPLARIDDIDQVLAAVDASTGAVPAVPVQDTLKRSGPDGRIVETVPRDGLWRAQTPQGFPRSLLARAYEQARADGTLGTATDDASLVERGGGRVMLVPGRAENLKITTPDDFVIAEALAKR